MQSASRYKNFLKIFAIVCPMTVETVLFTPIPTHSHTSLLSYVAHCTQKRRAGFELKGLWLGAEFE